MTHKTLIIVILIAMCGCGEDKKPDPLIALQDDIAAIRLAITAQNELIDKAVKERAKAVPAIKHPEIIFKSESELPKKPKAIKQKPERFKIGEGEAEALKTVNALITLQNISIVAGERFATFRVSKPNGMISRIAPMKVGDRSVIDIDGVGYLMDVLSLENGIAHIQVGRKGE